MKRLIAVILMLSVLAPPLSCAACAESLPIAAPSAILMEKETGTVLYEKKADEPGFPASVTKIMTMLLILEAMEKGALSPDDTVVASARAASFG